MEQLVALLMLAAASHAGCLVDTAKYIELITTTDNYKMVATISGADAKALKKGIDETPPPMLMVEAMKVDKIYVMVTADIPQAAYLLYSDKGCLKTVMTIPGRLFLQLIQQNKKKKLDL